MLSNIYRKINEHIEHKHDDIVVSLSGGVDSIVLLDTLIKLNYKNLHIVHFNYNVHSLSHQAEKHIRQLAKDNELQIKVHKTTIFKKNFESNARKDRYKKLNRYAKINNCKIIFTAHHFDDQVETLIMKDLSYSDWLSYLGICETYNMIRRPMLGLSKNEIYLYAKTNNLIWFEDETNTDLSILRNKIRNNIRKNFYNQEYINNLLNENIKSKIKIIEFDKYFKEYACKTFHVKMNAVFLNNNINIYFTDVYLKLFIKKIIKKYFQLNIQKSKKFWLNINVFFNNSIHGKKILIDSNIILINNRNEFIIYNAEKINTYKKRKLLQSLLWFDTQIVLGGKNLNSKKIIDVFKCSNNVVSKGLYLTHWIHGDHIRINKKISKKVSDVFINNKISAFRKIHYPIIRDIKEEIIWIPGLESKIFNNKNLTNIYWIENE